MGVHRSGEIGLGVESDRILVERVISQFLVLNNSSTRYFANIDLLSWFRFYQDEKHFINQNDDRVTVFNVRMTATCATSP